MKVEASVVFRFQASSLAEAGGLLDEVLGPARAREGVEVEQVNVTTPPGSAPVALPAPSPAAGYQSPLARSEEADGH